MIGIIPARSGSKGIPRKNIKKVGGIPLITWTIRNTIKSSSLEDIFISTDDKEIADIAFQEGCKVPFLRPKTLAGDYSKTSDVIIHTINTLNLKDEDIVLLQPTSPLRRPVDIINAIDIYKSNKNCYSVVSMVDAKTPIEIQYNLTKDGKLKKISPFSENKYRRQDCEIIYKPNGAIYIFNSDKFCNQKTFVTNDSLSYIMPLFESLDIDEIEDFKYLEFLCKNNISIVPNI